LEVSSPADWFAFIVLLVFLNALSNGMHTIEHGLLRISHIRLHSLNFELVIQIRLDSKYGLIWSFRFVIKFNDQQLSFIEADELVLVEGKEIQKGI
jgi:hypothetical protein